MKVDIDQRARAGARGAARRREVPADDAREPRRRRARLARRDERDPRAARQGHRDVHVRARSSRCPTSTATCRSTDVAHELPADAEERTIVFLDCGNIDRMPVSFLRRDDAHIVNIDHHHDNTNFGTANLVVDGASCTAEIIWDLTEDLGVEITPTIADALYVGARDRHRQVPVREHHRRVAPDGGRADRARGRRARDLPAAVRERAVRQAAPAGAGARPRRALRRRPADDLVHQARGLRGDRRRRERRRGHRRPHARARGRSSGRSCASS